MASIRARGDKWQALVRIKGQTVSRCFINKRDAERWAREQEANIDRGVFVEARASARTTLADALGKFLREVVPQHKGAGAESYRVSQWLRHPLARKTLAELSAKDLADYRDERMKPSDKEVRPAAAATVVADLAVISNLFETARRDWGMQELGNPAKLIRKPKIANARNRLLTDAETVAILAASESPEMKWMLQLALETAARRSELCTLEWRFVDLKARTFTLPVTKNDTSRVVPLSSKALSVLESMPRRLNGRVFGMRKDSVTQAFGRAVKRARQTYLESGGKDERFLVDVRWHDLRHTATTRLVTCGKFNIVEAAAITGHLDVRSIQRYSHPDPKELAQRLG